MSTAPALTNFNAGELSPLLDARISFEKYQSGCKLLQNFIPTVQGPARKRAGFHYVAPVKNQDQRVWLSSFEYNVTNAYILEFGGQYMRAFQNHGQVVSGVTPVEVVTPFLQTDLFDTDGICRLRTAQSGDFLYVTHGSYEPQIIKRVTASSFTIEAYRPNGGPFKDLNTTATTVYSSAATGSVTLTASSSIFQAGHVNSLFLLEAKNTNTIVAWEVAKSITSGDLRRVGNRVYQATSTGTTGTSTPVHVEGTFSDGGVSWLYLDAGFGWVRITGFTSGTQVTATVLSRIPTDATGSGNATTRWAHAAWSSVEGWPTDVTFFRERLWFARGQTLWSSVASGFDDFSSRDGNGSVTADLAITMTLASNNLNSVQWLFPDKQLIAGTAGGEFIIGELQNGNPIGPGNVKAELQSKFGSRPIVPVQAGSAILFIQRAGRKVREITYDGFSGLYKTDDRTALSEHITETGVVDIDYAQEPFSVAWATRADGKLIGFTWNAEQNVWGWHSHVIGGTSAAVESVACIPSPDGASNEVWAVIRRTINGATKRYVEYMEPIWEDYQSQTAAFYVDSGLRYSGASTTTITGLGHLEGQTIKLLVDGSPHPDRVVSGGQVTLQRAGTSVVAGLPVVAKMQTMRLESGGQNGTAQGKKKAMTKVVWRLKDTSTGMYGPTLDRLEEFNFRIPQDLMDQPVPPFEGDKEVNWPGGYDRDGYFCFYDDKPCPVTIVGIFPLVTVGGG